MAKSEQRTAARAVCGAVLALVVAAGAVPRAQDTVDVETDALRCWWRSSTGAVRVGEVFSVTLTCSAIETASVRIVPDRSKLEPAVVQLPPFEVVGGARADDLTTPARRFLQYRYDLRLIDETAFGADARLPALEVIYTVESQVAGGETARGRDQTYLLPPLAIRVLSLVPDYATDIRDAAPVGFGEIEDRATRANLLLVAAGVLAAAGVVFGIFAAVGLLRVRPGAAQGVRRELGDAAALRGIARTLDGLRAEAQGGWTPELTGRALAALRVVGAAAIGKPVAQEVLPNDGADAEGAVVLPGRRGARVGVAGAVTAAEVAAAGAGVSETRKATLDDVARGMTALTRARYGRDGALDEHAAGAGVEAGLRLARELASERSWIAERRGAIRRGVGTWREKAWAR